MKPNERLRAMKSKAVERMTALVNAAKAETRDLNAEENAEFESLKADCESLDAALKASPDPVAPQVPAPVVQAPVTLATDADAIKMAAALEERQRGVDIRKRVAQAKLSADFAEKLVSDGISAEKASAMIFEEMARTQSPVPAVGHHTAGIVEDKADKFAGQLKAALTLRVNAKADEATRTMGRDYASLSLLEMAREHLKVNGVNTAGLSRDEVARMALRGNERFSGGFHSTSDFPNILADVANKTLRQAYESAPRTFQPFCRQVTAADFKNINRVQLSDVPTLQAVNEHGEFHRATISDSKETYRLATYGEIIGVTRQTIINDDLSALSRIPQGMGVAAANLESDTVWGVLTANAALSDGVALFHADHDNLNTSAALAASSLGTMRTAFRLQTGPKGTILNLTPRYIMVPAALENTALQLITQSMVPAVYTNVIPEWVRTLQPVVEPRLDASSTTTWYAAAEPSQIDTLEYCYLEGQNGVYIETRNGFDVDGMEIKARLDFAAAAIDHRGLCKNTQ